MKNKKAEEAPKPAATAEKTAEEEKEEGEIQTKEMRTGRHMLNFSFKGVWHEIFDFRFFFMYEFPLGPWVNHGGRFEFLRKFAEIFEIKG